MAQEENRKQSQSVATRHKQDFFFHFNAAENNDEATRSKDDSPQQASTRHPLPFLRLQLLFLLKAIDNYLSLATPLLHLWRI